MIYLMKNEKKYVTLIRNLLRNYKDVCFSGWRWNDTVYCLWRLVSFKGLFIFSHLNLFKREEIFMVFQWNWENKSFCGYQQKMYPK